VEQREELRGANLHDLFDPGIMVDGALRDFSYVCKHMRYSSVVDGHV